MFSLLAKQKPKKIFSKGEEKGVKGIICVLATVSHLQDFLVWFVSVLVHGCV